MLEKRREVPVAERDDEERKFSRERVAAVPVAVGGTSGALTDRVEVPRFSISACVVAMHRVREQKQDDEAEVDRREKGGAAEVSPFPELKLEPAPIPTRGTDIAVFGFSQDWDSQSDGARRGVPCGSRQCECAARLCNWLPRRRQQVRYRHKLLYDGFRKAPLRRQGAVLLRAREIGAPPRLKVDRGRIDSQRFDRTLQRRNGLVSPSYICCVLRCRSLCERTFERWQSRGRTVSPGFGPSSTRTKFSPTSRGG